MKPAIPTAIIVTHSTEVFGPPNALADFLLAQGLDLFYLDHPLDFSPNRRSRLTIWRDGKKVLERSFPNWLAARPVNYLKDLVVSLWVLWHYAPSATYYFGFDSLSCLPAIWLRLARSYQHLIAYNADYSTARFGSPLFDAIYRWADGYSLKRVDRVWCVTERIADVRRRSRPEAQSVVVVPNGVALNLIPKGGAHDQGLVFIGNLTKEKGVDLLVSALAKTKQHRLTIFGDGAYRPTLEALVQELGLGKRVTFAGQLSNRAILERLADYQAGVALYQSSQSYVYYSDPLKVKEYLAAGLPVVVTGLPEIAETVKQAKAGVVLEDESQLPSALDTVIAEAPQMRQAALRLAADFDWSKIFRRAFRASGYTVE